MARVMGTPGASPRWTFGALFVIADTSTLPGVEVFGPRSADARATTAAIEIAAPVAAPDVVVDDSSRRSGRRCTSPRWTSAGSVSPRTAGASWRRPPPRRGWPPAERAPCTAVARAAPAAGPRRGAPVAGAVTGAAQRELGACVTLVATAPAFRRPRAACGRGVDRAGGRGDAVHLRLRRFADTSSPVGWGRHRPCGGPAAGGPLAAPWHLHVRRGADRSRPAGSAQRPHDRPAPPRPACRRASGARTGATGSRARSRSCRSPPWCGRRCAGAAALPELARRHRPGGGRRGRLVRARSRLVRGWRWHRILRHAHPAPDRGASR